MKIEIGESLILSWLRHSKHCQVVQLNWKPSMNAWELNNHHDIETIIKETTEYFSVNHNMNIFKKNSSWSQILQQGEIDALGLQISSGIIQNFYSVDVAFHEAGLNYGSKDETVSRVIKKMIRSALLSFAFFNVKSAEVIFATPKVHNNVLIPLIQCIDELNTFFEKYGLSCKFSLICNEDFRSQIFDVVTAFSDSISDTSELFMRSIQLYNLFLNPRSTQIEIPPREATYAVTNRLSHCNNDDADAEDVKIAEYVQTNFKRLIENGLLSANEVQNLTDKDYSKRTFKIHLPVFKKHQEGVSEKEQTYIKNHRRYYPSVYSIHGEKYYLCNHWVEKNHRASFNAWLKCIEEK